MGKINSRAKGAQAEREAAAKMRALGFPNARRGQQFSGSPDSPDVANGIPGCHPEVKRTEKFSLYPALDQAKRDGGGALPYILHRKNRRPWVVVVELDRLIEFCELVLQHRKGEENVDEERQEVD